MSNVIEFPKKKPSTATTLNNTQYHFNDHTFTIDGIDMQFSQDVFTYQNAIDDINLLSLQTELDQLYKIVQSKPELASFVTNFVKRFSSNL